MRIARTGLADYAGLLALCLCMFFLTPVEGRSEEVDLELVLAMDGSGSISDEEYLLQLEGTAAAFLDPAIQAAVTSGPTGRIAVAIVVWADANFLKITTGWHLLDSPQSAVSFARTVREFHFTSERKFGVGGGGGTGIGSGIGYAMAMMDTNKYQGLRRVIDVSGDGVESDPGDDRFIMLPEAKLLATAKDIQINGLPILTKKFPRLDEYYQNEVITGKGSFIVVADGFDDFARAILEKLDREITHRIARLDAGSADGFANLTLRQIPRPFSNTLVERLAFRMNRDKTFFDRSKIALDAGIARE